MVRMALSPRFRFLSVSLSHVALLLSMSMAVLKLKVNSNPLAFVSSAEATFLKSKVKSETRKNSSKPLRSETRKLEK